VRKLILAAGLAALWSTTACRKTGEGEYEVQKPVIGTKTDTVETGTVKDTITVPKVESEKKEVTVPQVQVKPSKERKP
jgi:hypothetical protein